MLQLQSSKELASLKGPRYTSIRGGRHCALWVNRILEEDDVDSPPCCEAVQEDFREAGLEWEEPQFCQELVGHLTKNAKRMKHVDRIVCFGLGNLGPGTIMAHKARAYLQHLTAITIGNALAKEQDRSGGGGKIDIFAQDPRYCRNCKEYLGKQGVVVVDHADGFAKIDEHTFVLTNSVGIDVREFASHILAHTATGLAGMLCDEIYSGVTSSSVIYSVTRKPDSPILLQWKEKCINKGFKMGDAGPLEPTPRYEGGAPLHKEVWGQMRLYLPINGLEPQRNCGRYMPCKGWESSTMDVRWTS